MGLIPHRLVGDPWLTIRTVNTHLLLVSLTTGLLFAAVYGIGACGRSTPSVGVANARNFTCPMHAEVVRSAPVTCPKCGMKLVEMAAPSEPGK